MNVGEKPTEGATGIRTRRHHRSRTGEQANTALPCLQGLLSSGLHRVHVIRTSRELYERDGITCVLRNVVSAISVRGR